MTNLGKRINIQKKFKKHPATQSSGMPFKSLCGISDINSAKFKKSRYTDTMTARPPAAIGSTPTDYPVQNEKSQGAGQSNPFYIWLLNNSITRTTAPINSTDGTVSSIDVVVSGSPNHQLTIGDTFYIYHPTTFYSKRLICDREFLATTTLLRTTSTAFQKGQDNFPSGSFIVKKYNLESNYTAVAPIGSGSTTYIWYLNSTNNWYSTSAYNLSLGTTVGAESDSTALRVSEFISTGTVMVTSVTIAFYTNKDADLEFKICRVPLVDDSTLNVTLASMTMTSHDGAYTANKNYVKTFVFSASNNLTVGQGVAVLCRSTSDSAVRIYGRGFIRII